MVFKYPFWAANPFFNPFWSRIQFGTILGKVDNLNNLCLIPGRVSDGGFGGQVPFFILGHVLKKTRSVICRRSVQVSCRNVGSGPVSCKNRCLASGGVSDQNWSSPGGEVGQGNKR